MRFPAGWNDPRVEKLWLYNLHYFDDLMTADAPSRAHWHQALVSQWIAENPPGRGIGWEPYPTSLRIVNWIKWAIAGWSGGERRLNDAAMHSLATQARWLSNRLEYHLLGNHLLANAKAVVFAGLFFGGSEGNEWLRKGIGLLDRQASEQILADGGHFELSPMYHALVLEDLLDVTNLLVLYSEDESQLNRVLSQSWYRAAKRNAAMAARPYASRW